MAIPAEEPPPVEEPVAGADGTDPDSGAAGAAGGSHGPESAAGAGGAPWTDASADDAGSPTIGDPSGDQAEAGVPGTGEDPGDETSPLTSGGGTTVDRGASVPWVEYEAENGVTNGKLIGPSRTPGDMASEASGRRAVRLETTGQSVQITSTQAANSIVVRYVIPDDATGVGMNATLSVYVGGVFRKKLALTSRYSWTYGAWGNAHPNDPAQGLPHHYYDEARALIGNVAAGATVSLRKDVDDSAPYYVVDLIDLEQVAAPRVMPTGFLSITQCGATAGDTTDDSAAIQKCADQARSQKRGLWIPPGTFRMISKQANVSDVTIRGAGMWHSVLSGLWAQFRCVGNNCRYYDFAILGDTTTRDDRTLESGFAGGAGTGSRLENIWIEHSKTGYWVQGATDGLVIHGCRVRNLFADGITFADGVNNSVVEQTHARNTGDNAFAISSPAGGGTETNNVFRFVTSQMPWAANCFALFGGRDNHVEDSACFDVANYVGVMIAEQFTSDPFTGTTLVTRTNVVRGGKPNAFGAIKLWGLQAPIGGVVIRDVRIDDSSYAGIEIDGPSLVSGVLLDGIQIAHPAGWGFTIKSTAKGNAQANGVVVSSAGLGGLKNYAGAAWTFTKGAGNSGW